MIGLDVARWQQGQAELNDEAVRQLGWKILRPIGSKRLADIMRDS